MNPQWKSNLSLIHKRVHGDASTTHSRITEEKRYDEPKLILDDTVSDMLKFGLNDNSVAFVDPALASFDAATPRFNPAAMGSNAALVGSTSSRSAHSARGSDVLFSPPGKAHGGANNQAMDTTFGWDTSIVADTDMYLRGNDTIDMTNVGDRSFDRLDRQDGDGDDVFSGSNGQEFYAQFDADKGSNDSASDFNMIGREVHRSSHRSAAAAAGKDSSMYSLGSEEKYVNDSQINAELAYDALHKSYSDPENSSENAFPSKKLDFGSSLDNASGMLAKHISRNKENDSGILRTPPRRDESQVSTLPSGGAGDASWLRPPATSSACPSSPDLKHASVVYNKTPSRIPAPTGKSGANTRISPTQDRSTSKFADALKKRGEEEGESSEAAMDVVHSTPQQTSKATSTHAVVDTPGGATARPPATPQFTPARSSHTHSQRVALTPDRPLLSTEQFDIRSADVNGFDEWKEAWTPVGKKYYYNRKTRKSAWRLPPSAVLVQVGPGHVKIFVPRQAEAIADKMDLTLPTARADALVPSDIIMSQTTAAPHTRTPLTGRDHNAVVSPSVTTVQRAAVQEPANLTIQGKDNSDSDWGNTRHTFTRTMLPGEIIPTVLVPIAELSSRPNTAAEGEVKRTPTSARTPSNKVSNKLETGSGSRPAGHKAGDATTVDRTKYSGLSSGAKTVRADKSDREQKEPSPGDCETLLFCPLCADVVIPIDFAKHMKSCPEISHLISNGEWKIALDSLESGMKALTASLAELSRGAEGASPLPSKALIFDAEEERNRYEETYRDDEEGVEENEILEEDHNRTMLQSMSQSAVSNKCAFCGKECSKSALSAHLLVCKVRKQMRLKHIKEVEEKAKVPRPVQQRFGSAPPDARRAGRGGVTGDTPERAASAAADSSGHLPGGKQRTPPSLGPYKVSKSNNARPIPKNISTTRVFM